MCHHMVLIYEHVSCYIAAMTDSIPLHPVDLASSLAGGREKLARTLGISVAAVGNWKLRGVPFEKCVAIERATQGAVTRRDLRPDDWQEIWPELAASPVNTGECAICSVAEQGA